VAAASMGLGAWSLLRDSISKNEEPDMSSVVPWILKWNNFHNSVFNVIPYEIGMG